MRTDSLHQKLRRLVGQRFDYAGEVWILIEILADDDSVVLRRCADCVPYRVQRNAYGMPSRRAADTLTIPITAPDSDDDYSEDILLLLEGRHPA